MLINAFYIEVIGKIQWTRVKKLPFMITCTPLLAKTSTPPPPRPLKETECVYWRSSRSGCCGYRSSACATTLVWEPNISLGPQWVEA